jgi:hypothetical protein
MSIEATDSPERSESLAGWNDIYTGVNAPCWPEVQLDDTTAWGELSLYHKRSKSSIFSLAFESSPAPDPKPDHEIVSTAEMDLRGSPIDSAFADCISQPDSGDAATESNAEALLKRITALEARVEKLETSEPDLSRTRAWVRTDRSRCLGIEGPSLPIIITSPPSLETAGIPGSFAVSPCS